MMAKNTGATDFAKANFLLRNNRCEEASHIYSRLIDAHPDYHAYHYNLGIALARLNKPDAATAAFRRAMELRGYEIVERRKEIGPEKIEKGNADTAEVSEILRYTPPRPSSDMGKYDVVIGTDLRFPGGSSGSTLEEIRCNFSRGWRTGLYHLPSRVLKRERPFHPGIADALQQGMCTLINLIPLPIQSRVLMFRHPSVIHEGTDKLRSIEAKEALLIVNHPPMNAIGRIDYILPYTVRRVRECYGLTPKVYPIGPLVRDSIDNAYDGTVRMERDDWVNIFDIERFSCKRDAPIGRPLRIGRHSRPGREKWPNSPQDILDAYPRSEGIEVHVLGGSSAPESVLGYRPENWTVYEFGAIPPERFLESIDVFVHFHHPSWVEAFGRVLVEAMASGLPIVVPHHFQPLLKDAAIYCRPSEVLSVLERLKNPEVYQMYSNRSRVHAMERFSYETHIRRMSGLGCSQLYSEGLGECGA